jgi:hypothetical protein
LASVGRAELFDSLDAYPPRWQLDTSDCDARITAHSNLTSGGVHDGGCETITFRAGVGSEAILVYPIEPVHPINDLVANVSLMSARRGARVGLRVRFPYFRDPQSRRPLSVIVYGAAYDRPGKFDSLGVGEIARELRIKIAKLRIEHGSGVNLNDPYVDALAINAYSGPGLTTLLLDEVRVRGMVPLGDHGRVDRVEGGSRKPASVEQRRGLLGDRVIEDRRLVRMSRAPEDDIAEAELAPAFPVNDLIRVLEHQGEPLAWVRSLGFDAVLLPRPPTAELLREAIQTQMLIYCPPPSAPEPALQTLLDPVVAWYLGGGVALDERRVAQTDATVRRLRAFPDSWRRPIVIAPVESWSAYAAIGDAIVCDAPLRARDVSAAEQSELFQRVLGKIGPRKPFALGIESSPPRQLTAMNRAIQSAIGAPMQGSFRWHSMLTQAVQSLGHLPRAVVYRSEQSLVSGTPSAQQRSMALSYVNRFIAMVSPWIAVARPAGLLPVNGADYRCARVDCDGDQFLFLTSNASIKDQVLAGDGKVAEIVLPPEMVHRTAWRMTGFEAQRIAIEPAADGAQIQVVSPDVAEILVISQDAALGARLSRSANRYLAKAAADRWQLCSEQVRQVRRDWEHAVTSGATEASLPIDLLNVAERTLADAEAVYRAGDARATLRLSRRADAWATRAAVKLSGDLLAASDQQQSLRFTSSPPLDEGRAILQAAWHPLMQSEGWSGNLIVSGNLDRQDVLSAGGWTFGQRDIPRTRSGAGWIDRGFFSGRGAVRMFATSTSTESLGGGYEGTVAMLASPPIKIQPRQAVRIDAMVRTLGFGSPHQGILVYDNLGGHEMGVLVSDAERWTPVRLYRQNVDAEELKVMFEIIGDGEAVVDEVSVRVWDPSPLPELPLRPLSNR